MESFGTQPQKVRGLRLPVARHTSLKAWSTSKSAPWRCTILEIIPRNSGQGTVLVSSIWFLASSFKFSRRPTGSVQLKCSFVNFFQTPESFVGLCFSTSSFTAWRGPICSTELKCTLTFLSHFQHQDHSCSPSSNVTPRKQSPLTCSLRTNLGLPVSR